MTIDEIERAAREICEAKGYDPDGPIDDRRRQWEAFKELAKSTLSHSSPTKGGEA